MSAGTLEALEGEAGDDRRRDAEIARLNEMYRDPSVIREVVPGPGDIRFTASRTGHLLLSRQHIRPDTPRFSVLGPENYIG